MISDELQLISIRVLINFHELKQNRFAKKKISNWITADLIKIGITRFDIIGIHKGLHSLIIC